MEINKPEVLADVTTLFNAYEKALTNNDVATLDQLFWKNANTIRFGAGENLYGYDEIAAFRATRPSKGLERDPLKARVTTFGDDFAITNMMFTRENTNGKIGRQSQVWVRTEDGWRIVSAHVSVIDDD